MADKIETVIECSEVDFERILLNKMEMGDMMLSTRPYYDYEGSTYKKIPLAFRTPFINITQDGIPDLHEVYCPDDSKRLYIRLPLDPTQPISEFITMHERFDEHFKTQQVREVLFGKAAKNYDYTPSVKKYKPKVQEDEEDEFATKKVVAKKTTKPAREYHPSVRYLFNTDFGSNKPTTEFWIKESEDAPATQIFPNTVTDLKQHVPFGSRVSCVVTLSKVWGEKTKKDERLPFKLYSIKFNVQNMCIIPRKNISMSTFWSGAKFWNSGSNSNPNVAIPNSNPSVAIPNSTLTIKDTPITNISQGDIPISTVTDMNNSYQSEQPKSASPAKRKAKAKAKAKPRSSPNNSDAQDQHDSTCEEVFDSD